MNWVTRQLFPDPPEPTRKILYMRMNLDSMLAFELGVSTMMLREDAGEVELGVGVEALVSLHSQAWSG
jgi:hypothetical protein